MTPPRESIVGVILSGGAGSRLWPLSRRLEPKQLQPLLGAHTMLDDTLARAGRVDAARPIVVCNADHRFLVAEALRASGGGEIILEPMGRNTAPAIAVAAHCALERGGDPLILAMPADHQVGDVDAFVAAIHAGVGPAREGRLVTFGIVPSGPATGYGYIRSSGGAAGPVLAFVEKPDAARAQAYVDSGEYAWNAGIFLFSARTFLDELARHTPEMAARSEEAWATGRRGDDFVTLGEEAFAACPSNSIDYAVMEKTDRAWVVPMDAAWSDVGSWSALLEASSADEAGNVTSGDVLLHDTEGCYVRADSRLVATAGLRDHVVVETADAVLVVPTDRAQDVKALVEALRADGRPEPDTHQLVRRPWGSYENLFEREGFKVKHIVVDPGASLSLQLHHKRAEHWTVVRGRGVVTVGDERREIRQDQDVYIPVETRHRIENPGTEPLEFVEVQVGPYLGEDDIVRFEDRYGRAGSR